MKAPSKQRSAGANSSSVTNVEVVVYVVASLGGASRSIHSEDVAATCYELSPSRFGWRLDKYRERGWPDKFIVKSALENAKKEENGALVDGVYGGDLHKDGWSLTEHGVRWFQAEHKRIETALNAENPGRLQQVPAHRDAKRIVSQLRKQALFRDFQKTRQVPSSALYAFTDLLQCSPDAGPELVATKFSRIKAAVTLAADSEARAFVEACATTFAGLLEAGRR